MQKLLTAWKTHVKIQNRKIDCWFSIHTITDQILFLSKGRWVRLIFLAHRKPLKRLLFTQIILEGRPLVDIWRRFLRWSAPWSAGWPRVWCHTSVRAELDEALINNTVGRFAAASLPLWQQGQQLYYESRCAYTLSSPREQQEGHWFSCNNITLCTAGSKLISYVQ